VHVPNGSYRSLRHLAQLRKKLVGRRMGCKLQIKSLLLLEQLPFPVKEDGRSSWSKWTLQQLSCLECAPVIRFKLDRYLGQLEFHHQEILKTEKELRRFCHQDPELSRCIHLLMTISGIGARIGMYLLSRIGDWRLLKNSRQLASFFGLVPSENSTGEGVNRGSITRTGDRLGRAMLVEAAWIAIRKDPELRECYQRIFTANNGDKAASKLAIVAVARRLTTRTYAVLTQQRPYRLVK
jgi:transposase